MNEHEPMHETACRLSVKLHCKQLKLGSYHFLAHGGGGCGRNGMKDSVKFLIPLLEAAEKLLIPLSICENFV